MGTCSMRIGWHLGGPMRIGWHLGGGTWEGEGGGGGAMRIGWHLGGARAYSKIDSHVPASDTPMDRENEISMVAMVGAAALSTPDTTMEGIRAPAAT